MKPIVLFILFLISCNNSIGLHEKKRIYTIQIFLEEPYCGGAKPQSLQHEEAIIKNPIGNREFYLEPIVNKKYTKKKVSKYVTDSMGAFSANLSHSEYGLYDKYKLLDFEQFYKARQSNKNFLLDDSIECYRKWWSTPDAVLIVDFDSKIEVVLANKCYIGTNPCLKYIGPLNR